jgi:excisionase family DNA binding protein
MTREILEAHSIQHGGSARHTNSTAFLTYKEFARESRLSVSTVRKHVRQGELRATRIGRAVRIPRSELERLVRLSELQTANRGED